LRKYITTAADFAYCVQCVHTLWKRISYEGEDIHANMLQELKACLASLADCMKAFVEQEVEELKAGKEEGEALVAAGPEVAAMTAKLGDMSKADFADNLLTLFKYGARNSKMDQERIQRIHDVTVELMAKCNTPAKVDSAGELAKSADQAPALQTVPEDVIQKAVQGAVEPLQKMVESLQSQLSAAQTELIKLSSQPVPTRVRLRAVSKGEDLDSEHNEGTQVAPVTIHGQVNEAATLIKAAHSTGGRPFLRKD
jgi:prefoldin subunit 5